MLQNPEEDKVVQTNHFDRDMSILTKDGRKIPTKGHVTETVHASGRVDVQVAVDKPFELTGEQIPPEGCSK